MSEIEFSKDFPYTESFIREVEEMGFKMKYITYFNWHLTPCFTLEFNKGSKRVTCNFRFKKGGFTVVGIKKYPYFKLKPYCDANSVKENTLVLNGLLDTLREINEKICEIQTVSEPTVRELLESKDYESLSKKNTGPRKNQFPGCA